MKCNYHPDRKARCDQDAALDVKIGTVWGHYCVKHALDALEARGESLMRFHEEGDEHESS